jgi:hypothetical protein
MSDAQWQLQHAKEHLDLAGQYSGGKAATPTLSGGERHPASFKIG